MHGLLRTLQQVGFVEQDSETGKYQLGAALLHMGSSYLDGNELRTRALNWSDSLAARTHEAVRIGTLHEGQVLIVHHVFRPDDSLQTLDVGSLLPAHATALGKVLLAYHPYRSRRARQGRACDAYTDATITDPERLERELERVASAGMGRRRRRAGRRAGVAGGADRRSPRRRPSARWASSGRPNVCSRPASRAATCCRMSARPRARFLASSARSRGRDEGR